MPQAGFGWTAWLAWTGLDWPGLGLVGLGRLRWPRLGLAGLGGPGRGLGNRCNARLRARVFFLGTVGWAVSQGTVAAGEWGRQGAVVRGRPQAGREAKQPRTPPQMKKDFRVAIPEVLFLKLLSQRKDAFSLANGGPSFQGQPILINNTIKSASFVS